MVKAKEIKSPLKHKLKEIIDANEIVIAQVSDSSYGQAIVEAVNLDYKTKAMTMEMWRVINFIKANEKFLEDKLLEKSVKRIEKYLMKDVNYE